MSQFRRICLINSIVKCQLLRQANRHTHTHTILDLNTRIHTLTLSHTRILFHTHMLIILFSCSRLLHLHICIMKGKKTSCLPYKWTRQKIIDLKIFTNSLDQNHVEPVQEREDWGSFTKSILFKRNFLIDGIFFIIWLSFFGSLRIPF
jgi:hypothetical protein